MSFQHSKYYQQVIDLINKSEFNKAKTILENNKNIDHKINCMNKKQFNSKIKESSKKQNNDFTRRRY